MTSKQARLIRFALKYPGWHAAGADARATVETLIAWGIFERSTVGNLFRVIQPEHDKTFALVNSAG